MQEAVGRKTSHEQSRKSWPVHPAVQVGYAELACQGMSNECDVGKVNVRGLSATKTHFAVRAAVCRSAISACRPSIIRANALRSLFGGVRLYFANMSASACCNGRLSFSVLSMKSSMCSGGFLRDTGRSSTLRFCWGVFVRFMHQ